LKTGIKGRFLGNDSDGNYSSHEEGCTGSFFMMGKYVGFTVEVLLDYGQGVQGQNTM